MTTLNTIIEEEKKEALRQFQGMTQCDVWCPKNYIDTVVTTAMQRAYEAGQSEERAKIREEVESVIEQYEIDGEWQLNQVLSRVEKELLAKLTPDKTNGF